MNLKVYCVSFNPIVINPNLLLYFLDSRAEILNWHYLFPGCLLVASKFSHNFIAELIHHEFSNTLFIISQIFGNLTNGWMNKETWEFITTPKSSGKWAPVDSSQEINTLVIPEIDGTHKDKPS